MIKKCFNKKCNNITANPKFCSRSCSAIESNKIPKRKLRKKCSHCDNIVRNYKSTLCEKHFQEKNNLKNLTIKDYTSRKSLQNLHTSSKFAHIRGLNRSWNFDLTLLPCFNCGYDKHVELAHIIPISSFPETTKLSVVNNRNNIIQLCRNCHWEFDNGLLILAFPEQ